MRMYAVSDDRDTLTGLRLAGIDGELATSRRETADAVARVRENAEIAVILVDEDCAAMIPETVSELKLSSANPLLVVIPGANGSSREPDSITRLIREAIGIKI